MKSTLFQKSNEILVAQKTSTAPKNNIPNKETYIQTAYPKEKSTLRKNKTCGCLLITGASYCNGSHINLP